MNRKAKCFSQLGMEPSSYKYCHGPPSELIGYYYYLTTVFSLIEAPGAKAVVRGASIFSPNALNTKINMIRRKQNVLFTQPEPITYINIQDLLQWKLLKTL